MSNSLYAYFPYDTRILEIPEQYVAYHTDDHSKIVITFYESILEHLVTNTDSILYVVTDTSTYNERELMSEETFLAVLEMIKTIHTFKELNTHPDVVKDFFITTMTNLGFADDARISNHS